MALFLRSERPSMATESSKQSPTVIWRSVPPLTAKMVAARRNAAACSDRPADDASQNVISSAKPSGSRSLAINGTRFTGARGFSTQSRLGMKRLVDWLSDQQGDTWQQR